MGDWHVYRGFNPLHQLDVGDFLAEQADRENVRSLHIMVLGVRGEHVAYGGYRRPLKHFTAATDATDDYRWLQPAADLAAKDSWTLYDLRKLRFRRDLALEPEWNRVVYGYDLLVLIPELTPADLIR